MWWFQSPKIAFGEDALEVLKDLKGKQAFIVTDNTIRNLGYVDIVSSYLKEAGMDIRVFDKVESEPSNENVIEGAKTQFTATLLAGPDAITMEKIREKFKL